MTVHSQLLQLFFNCKILCFVNDKVRAGSPKLGHTTPMGFLYIDMIKCSQGYLKNIVDREVFNQIDPVELKERVALVELILLLINKLVNTRPDTTLWLIEPVNKGGGERNDA